MPSTERAKTQAAQGPHLIAASAALIVVLLALFGGIRYAEGVESAYVRAFGPGVYPQKTYGQALAVAALCEPDILLLYGSSELRGGSEYGAAEFFKYSPTGFSIFQVGLHAANTLIYLQELSSVGPQLNGKKIVISLSPGFFLLPMLDRGSYEFNFSHLHGYDLIYNAELDWQTKRRAARRMAQYPRTLEKDPLLAFGVEKLKAQDPISQGLYYAAFPLARLQSFILDLQDHWQVVSDIHANPNLDPTILRDPAEPNWESLIGVTEQFAQDKAQSNPYGIADVYWKKSGKDWLQRENSMTDAEFLGKLDKAAEWSDLELLLRALRAWGAKPLLLSMPWHGTFYEFMGVSKAARDQYYDRLESVAEKANVPLVDFREHDGDLYFLEDFLGHISAHGWLYYDQVIDSFYRDKLPAADQPTRYFTRVSSSR